MKWPESISITQVALAFITGLMVLVSLIGYFSAYQTRAATHSWNSIIRVRHSPS